MATNQNRTIPLKAMTPSAQNDKRRRVRNDKKESARNDNGEVLKMASGL